MTHSALERPHADPFTMLDDTARIAPTDFASMLRCLWRGKWIVALCVLISLTLGGYYAFAVKTPRYAATTTLQVASPSALTGGQTRPINLQGEATLIRGSEFLGQVVLELDLRNDPSFNRYLNPVSPLSLRGIRTRLRELLTGQSQEAPDQIAVLAKTVENLRNTIKIAAQEDSETLTITVSLANGQHAIQIANSIAAIYLQNQFDNTRNAAAEAMSWLSDKVQEQQVVLAEKETAISDLISLAKVSDQSTFDELNRAALETDKRLHDARTSLASLRPATDTAQAANARRLERQISTLENVQASLETQLAAQSAGLMQLNQLQREADAARVLYESFLERLRDVSLDSGSQTPQNRIVSPAGPARYVAQRKTLMLAISALVGLVMGVCWVFLRDMMRSGLRDPGKLQAATDLPVMAQIPMLRLRQPMQFLDKLHQPAAKDLRDAAANLRTALLASGKDEPPQTILCTASAQGEQKAVLATVLSQTLASMDRSVLLIDADPDTESVMRFINARVQTNFQAVLAGKIPLAHAIHRDARWSVDVLAGHDNGHAQTDVFSTAAFANLLHRLREQYDYIVLNAPPVLTGPDARILAQHMDAVIYAVRANHTPLSLIRAGQHALAAVHAPITGLVMTKVDAKQQVARSRHARSRRLTLPTQI